MVGLEALPLVILLRGLSRGDFDAPQHRELQWLEEEGVLSEERSVAQALDRIRLDEEDVRRRRLVLLARPEAARDDVGDREREGQTVRDPVGSAGRDLEEPVRAVDVVAGEGLLLDLGAREVLGILPAEPRFQAELPLVERPGGEGPASDGPSPVIGRRLPREEGNEERRQEGGRRSHGRAAPRRPGRARPSPARLIPPARPDPGGTPRSPSSSRTLPSRGASPCRSCRGYRGARPSPRGAAPPRLARPTRPGAAASS